MNHVGALAAVARAHPRAGLGANLPAEIVQGVKELITLQTDTTKAEIKAEVDKKGEEAKTRATYVAFGFGAAGVVVGALIMRAVR